MRLIWPALALVAAWGASAARAEDTTICGKGMICASAPQSVVDALKKAGYTAELGKDGEGDPMIESEVSGYKFTIYFYGCVEHSLCDSMQFQALFQDEELGADGSRFANGWNRRKRFVQLAHIADDKSVRLSYDVTTVGGLNQANFEDVLAWWDSLLGDLSPYFDEFKGKK